MLSEHTYSRNILNSTAELLCSAVRHIDMLVAWLDGDGEACFGGLAVRGSVRELARLKTEIRSALTNASVFITDQWPYIENNKARLQNYVFGAYLSVRQRRGKKDGNGASVSALKYPMTVMAKIRVFLPISL